MKSLLTGSAAHTRSRVCSSPSGSAAASTRAPSGTNRSGHSVATGTRGDMIPSAEHWRVSVCEALQRHYPCYAPISTLPEAAVQEVCRGSAAEPDRGRAHALGRLGRLCWSELVVTGWDRSPHGPGTAQEFHCGQTWVSGRHFRSVGRPRALRGPSCENCLPGRHSSFRRAEPGPAPRSKCCPCVVPHRFAVLGRGTVSGRGNEAQAACPGVRLRPPESADLRSRRTVDRLSTAGRMMPPLG